MESFFTGVLGVAIDEIFDVYKFLQEITSWMKGLIPLAGALMIGYHAFMKNAAQDEQQAMQHQKNIRSILVYSMIGLAASFLIGFLSSYAGDVAQVINPCNPTEMIDKTTAAAKKTC